MLMWNLVLCPPFKKKGLKTFMLYKIRSRAPECLFLRSAYDICLCFPSYNWDIPLSYKIYLFYLCSLAMNYGIWKDTKEAYVSNF